MTALLKQAAVIGMHALESGERGERIRNAAQITLADGDQVQDIAVLGDLREERLGRCESRGELALFQEPTRAQDFCFDREDRRIRCRLSHLRLCPAAPPKADSP